MKKLGYFKLVFFIMISFVQSGVIYSQSSIEYFENRRLELKEKKVKIIYSYETGYDELRRKEFIDENGYLYKLEEYQTSYDGERTFISLIAEIDVNSKAGFICGKAILYDSEGVIRDSYSFDMESEYFYTLYLEDIPIDEVKYIFDEQGKLTEKRKYSNDNYGPNEFEKEVLIYDNNNKLIESKHYVPENSTISVSYYNYNSYGLLESEKVSYDFQNRGRNFGVRYEYEFY